MGCEPTDCVSLTVCFVQGIIDVCCVYVGGTDLYPTYRAVGDYTEGVTVVYDPSATTYRACLDHFFAKHNPFKNIYVNGERQYTYGVWYHDEKQRIEIEQKVCELENASGQTLTTVVEPLNEDISRRRRKIARAHNGSDSDDGNESDTDLDDDSDNRLTTVYRAEEYHQKYLEKQKKRKAEKKNKSK